MDVEKQMEQDSASQVFASFAEPFKSFGEVFTKVVRKLRVFKDGNI